MNESWKAELEEWLAPFLGALGRKVRARLCPLYVAGLIGPGDRKSIQPMAGGMVASATTSCITSWRPEPEIRLRWKS